MAIHYTLSFLFFISYVSISFHLATSHLSPAVSPSQGPASAKSQGSASSSSPGIASAPSFGPTAYAPVNYVSQPPSASGSSSESISPNADGPSASQPPSASGSSSESISPNADGPSASDDDINFEITSTTSSDASPGLKNICDSTDYPSLCLATVTPHLNGDPDIPSVLQLSVKAGIDYAKHASTIAKEAAEKPENADLAPSLRDCMDFYDDVVDNYEKALSAFPDQDIGTMKIMLSAALTDIGDCDDALKGASTASPLTDFGYKLTNITSNCIAIATLMR